MQGTDAVLMFKQFPETDKWTRIEMTCEEDDDGQFFLSLSVEGKELGRMGTDSKERTEVVVGVGKEYIDSLPLSIRKLAVGEAVELFVLIKSNISSLSFESKDHGSCL